MIGEVAGVTGVSAAQAAMKANTGMDKNDFLQLFVTQMQNQDPLNPKDSTEFVSQLAQLTQVEQAYNSNRNLESLLSQGNNGAAMAAVNLIGNEVQAPGDQVNLGSGATSLNYDLTRPAAQLNVTVRDQAGGIVRTLVVGEAGAGQGNVVWDGKDDAGIPMAPGIYSFSVAAQDAGGTAVTATPIVKGRVDEVDMSGTTPILTVAGVQVNLSNVLRVKG